MGTFLVSHLAKEWKAALAGRTVTQCVVFTHSFNVPYLLDLLPRIGFPKRVPLFIVFHRWSFRPHHVIKTPKASRALKKAWGQALIESGYDVRLLRVTLSKHRMHCKGIFWETREAGLDALFFCWNFSYTYHDASRKPHLLYRGLPTGWSAFFADIRTALLPHLEPTVQAGHLRNLLRRWTQMPGAGAAAAAADATTHIFLIKPRDASHHARIRALFKNARQDPGAAYYAPVQNWKDARVTVHSSFVNLDRLARRCAMLRTFLDGVRGPVRVCYPEDPAQQHVHEKVLYRSSGGRVAWLCYTTANLTAPSYGESRARSYNNFEVGLLHFPRADAPLPSAVVRRLTALGARHERLGLACAADVPCA